MDTTTIVIAVIAAVILLAIGGYLGVVFARRQRTKRLQNQFGAEYEHVMREVGDQEEAEEQLEARIERVKGFDIRALSDEETQRYTQEWRATQAKFVDHPVVAIQEANELIKEVMAARGYPVENFDQRAADISVHYPDLVTNYRGMRDVTTRSEHEEVSTEDVRQAMLHARSLFEELVGAGISEYKEQKEKI